MKAKFINAALSIQFRIYSPFTAFPVSRGYTTVGDSDVKKVLVLLFVGSVAVVFTFNTVLEPWHIYAVHGASSPSISQRTVRQ